MSFLNPIYLIGLIAAAIPVIIHLVRLHRRETLAFPTITFLEELKKSTLKKLKIKRNLLLLLRVIALIILALALARPYISGQSSHLFQSPQPVLYGFLIDNSPSMNQIDENGPYFEQGKKAIRQIARNARGQDRFILMKTNGSAETAIMTRQRLLRELDHTSVLNAGSYLGKRLKLMQQLVQKQTRNYRPALFWFTDGQRSTIDSLASGWKTNAGLGSDTWNIVKVGTRPTDNVAVTDIRIPGSGLVSGGNLKITASVKNFGDQEIKNEFVSLLSGGTVMGQYPLHLTPHQLKEFIFELPVRNNKTIKGEIEVEGDPFTFDNKRYFSLNVPENKKILIVNGHTPNAYLSSVATAVAEQDSTVQTDFCNVNEWTNKPIESYDAIMLNGLAEIPAFMEADLGRLVKQGKDLIIIPSEKLDINSMNNFLSQVNAGKINGFRGEYGQFSEVARILKPDEKRHPLFTGLFEKRTKPLDYPVLYYYYLIHPPANAQNAVLLRSNLGDPLLSDTRSGSGHVVVSALGLTPEWSTLPTSSFFAPLVYRLFLYATHSEMQKPETMTLGSTFRMILPFQSDKVELRVNGRIIRPDMSSISGGTLLTYDNSDWLPGWVEVDAPQERKIISVNQNIMESDFTSLDNKTLQKRLNQLGLKNRMLDLNSINHSDTGLMMANNAGGREVWNIFIWIGLILLLTETIISRWYRVETI